MRFHARVWHLALLAGMLACLCSSPAALGAELPGIEKFAAVNCAEGQKECAHETQTVSTVLGPQTYSITKEPSKGEAEAQGFVKAGGHVPYGVTDFKVATVGSLPNEVPTAIVKHVRTDVAPGLSTNPQAVPMCTSEEFGKEAIPGTGFFLEPECEENTEIGVNQVTVYAGSEVGDLALEGSAYNLTQPQGRSALYGVAIKLPKPLTEHILSETPLKGTPAEKGQYYAHTLIEGNVEWGQEAKGTNQGDYHDYFEIEVSTALPLISSRLVFFGRSGEGDFITNATSCPGHNTTTLKLTDVENKTVERPFTTPIGLTECEKVPFEPAFSLTPATTASDQPDAFTTEASLPHNPEANALDDSQVRSASITLPEGMTLNPSAAYGIEACTPAQAHIHSETFGVACPEGSKLGTVTLDVPGLPNGSLTGSAYLGGPETGPITGPPYVMYVVANSARYGISVRLQSEVVPNEFTGQLTAVFPNPPEQPFTKLLINFDRGTLAAVANPLMCGTPAGTASFAPFTGTPASKALAFGVAVTGCAPTLPFSLSQSTQDEPASAGAHASYTFNLARPSGQQYLQRISTTLPAGLVGAIPDVTLCGEPQANDGTCGPASRIGTATVAAGAGSFPYTFSGPVYMTGPYNGAPFGLSIAVPAVAGPFNLGTVVTRSAIYVDQTTARVSAVSTLPTIVKGVPMRLRSISVNVNRQGFLFNPTNCSPQATETTLTSTFGAVQGGLSTPFQVEGCGALAFKPSFSAKASGKTSKANGASLETTLNQGAGQANIKSVLVQLPKQLPSRLTTLQKACLEATFAANPYSCPAGSMVGSARAATPTLPVKLVGPAYLVSHGGEAFPDLDLVLEGDGVRVILIGHTNIRNGITTTNFSAAPDVPVSSITVNLPTGPHSALAANGNLCVPTLVMPTTITGQNGVVIKQNTKIAMTSCGVQIVGHKVIGSTAYLTVKTFAAGRITGSGSGLASARRSLSNATNAASLKVRLTGRARSRRRPFRVKIRVSFAPRKGSRSSATVTVRFR